MISHSTHAHTHHCCSSKYIIQMFYNVMRAAHARTPIRERRRGEGEDGVEKRVPGGAG